jgi:hypothetical protein
MKVNMPVFDRVQALLNWLKDSARLALQRSSITADGYRRVQQELSSLPSPAPSHIQCVSAILWQSNDLPVEYDLGSLITRELVRYVCNDSVYQKCFASTGHGFQTFLRLLWFHKYSWVSIFVD